MNLEFRPTMHDVTGDKPVSRASENRRATKPIMEKRRRARINQCLSELKTLILDALNKDPSRHSKLEKADILEMTVRHLQNIQRQQMAAAISTDSSVLNKFKAGFSECASEVTRYVSRLEGVDPALRRRLLSHLTGCMTAMGGQTPKPLSVHIGGDLNNNGNVLSKGAQPIFAGLSLIPGRLPNGDFAFLLPQSAMTGQFRLPPVSVSGSQSSWPDDGSDDNAVPSPVASDAGSDVFLEQSFQKPHHREVIVSPPAFRERIQRSASPVSNQGHPETENVWRPW